MDSYSVFLKTKNDYYLKLNLDKISTRKNNYMKDELKTMLKPKFALYSEIERNYEIKKNNSSLKDRLLKINNREIKLEENKFVTRKLQFSQSVRKIESQKLKDQNIYIFRRIFEQYNFNLEKLL